MDHLQALYWVCLVVWLSGCPVGLLAVGGTGHRKDPSRFATKI